MEDFITINSGSAHMYFGKLGKLKIKKDNDDFKILIKGLKEQLILKDIAYLNQVHGINIIEVPKNFYKDVDADGVFTKERRFGLLIFTADCVPLLMYNKKSGVIGAFHSGYKGTLNSIAKKAIESIDESGIDRDSIEVYIGPHIRQCCYEIGEEVRENFKQKEGYKEDYIIEGKLSLGKVINGDLISLGILEENIHEITHCTKCSKDPIYNSYRGQGDAANRQVSLIYLD